MTAIDVQEGRRRVGRVRAWNAFAWLLLVACVGLSIVGGSVWSSEARSQATQSFRAEAATVGTTVTTALLRMDDLTVAARSLLEENPNLTNGEFTAWYQNLAAQSRYPGALGFGYVEIVAAGGLAKFAAVVHSDPVPGFARPAKTLVITPPGTHKSYCLIRLGVAGALGRLIPGGAGYNLCPVPGANSFLASPASGRISVVPASIPSLGQILIVSAPVYSGGTIPTTSAAREAHVLGWMVGGFAVGSVLGGAVVGDRDLAISIAHEISLHPSTPSPTGPSLGRLTSVARIGRASAQTPFRSRFTLDADGHWIVTVAKTPEWGWLSPTAQGAAVLGGGILVTLLVFLLVEVLARGRARALQMVAEKTDELRYQALHDPLTGLPNRALIMDRAQQLLAHARRKHTAPAAMFLDLDDFKTVNDTFGHGVGDELLQAVAARISAALREPDTVGRLGGDEFIVLVEDQPHAARPELVAERLLELLQNPFELDVLGDGSLSVTASIGIAIGDRHSGADLLRDADIALYQAKASGKRCYAVFQQEMQESVHGRLLLEIDLHKALDKEELFLEYQPTFNLSAGSVSGAEALLRWDHPNKGVVLPDEFIPIAESSGLILPIGAWVLERACAQAQAWHEDGYEIDISVNVSGLQLDDPGFRDTVAAALTSSRLDPAFLILEITETVLMRDPVLVAARLADLKALGIRIAIDDFGTGYSSLAYLQRFPVDALKIDKSFVSQIPSSGASRALIHTLVQLGKSLHLSTVAEGIENDAQLDRLREEDCELGQGFLLSRPLGPDAMRSVLERSQPARTPNRPAPTLAASRG